MGSVAQAYRKKQSMRSVTVVHVDFGEGDQRRDDGYKSVLGKQFDVVQAHIIPHPKNPRSW